MVHAVALRALSNHHDAQDVTQAVFIALAREAPKLAKRPSVAGWLHTVSRRLSLNSRQSRERRQKREQTAVNESARSMPDSVLSTEFRRELDTALEKLPERYRQPLVLFHLEGASLAEAAQRLDLHPTTLRTRLSRARERLRQALGRRGVEVGSVAILGSIFIAEVKGAPFSPALATKVAKAATGSAASVPPSVLELASKASGPESLLPLSSLTSLVSIMKTKAILVSAVLIALAALGTTVYKARNAGGISGGQSASEQSGFASVSKLPRDRAAAGGNNALSGFSSVEAFKALAEEVLLIPDDAARLAAIRDRLGIAISEEAYGEAVAAYGYRVDPLALLGQLVSFWGKENPEALAAWTGGFPQLLEEEFLREIFRLWLDADADSALVWAETEELDPELIATARKSLAEGFSEAADMVPLPESSSRTTAVLADLRSRFQAVSGSGAQAREDRARLSRQIASLVSRWSHRDPRAAVEFAYSLEGSNAIMLRSSLPLLDYVKRWSFTDPDGALDWAAGLGNVQQRTEALLAILPSWAIKYPDRSVDEAIDLSGVPDSQYNRLVGSLVADWSARDPDAAMDYALEIRDEGLRAEMVSEVVRTWSRKDAAEARQRISLLPAGPERDASLGQIARAIAPTDFGEAGRIVMNIGDPVTRSFAAIKAIGDGEAIRNDLPAALRLADEGIAAHDPGTLRGWAGAVAPEDIPVFTAWLESSDEKGRIGYHVRIPENLAPAERDRLVEETRRKQFQFILGGLKQGEE